MTDEEFVNDLIKHFAKMLVEYEKAQRRKLTFNTRAFMHDGRKLTITMEIE